MIVVLNEANVVVGKTASMEDALHYQALLHEMGDTPRLLILEDEKARFYSFGTIVETFIVGNTVHFNCTYVETYPEYWEELEAKLEDLFRQHPMPSILVD